MGSASESRRYTVTPALIGWAHTQIDRCIILHYKQSGTKPALVAKILTTNFGVFFLT